MSIANLQDWAQETFGCAELNDPRRAKRLVVIACEELGNITTANKNKPTKKRAIQVHSTMMIDANSEQTLGLANQHYWSRHKKQDVTSGNRPKCH